MQIKTVNESQAGEVLLAVKGAQPISFTALVDAKARKTGNPFGEIRKLSKVLAFTGFDYEASVNRQLDREGKGQLTFAAAERSWGERIAPAVVRNNGKLYLVAKVERTHKPVYLVRQGGFLRIIAKELIAPFLPPVRHAENQGTEKEIVYRNYSLANIASFRIGGQAYRIRHAAA